MNVAETYSHLNGLEFLLVHKPTLWQEIQNVISAVDAQNCRTKVSKEKTKKGRLLYSPIGMNVELRRLLRKKSWQESRVSYWVTKSEKLMIFLYLASTLYHSLPNPSAKMILKRIDHSAIFLLIAGTYTPFTLIHLRGAWGWSIFGIIWGLAIAGIVLKVFAVTRFKKLSLVLYILMGWLCIIAFKEMIKKIPSLSLTLLIIGGLLYTLGVVFYMWKKLPYGHAIWHLFVLGGSALHFLAVLTSI